MRERDLGSVPLEARQALYEAVGPFVAAYTSADGWYLLVTDETYEGGRRNDSVHQVVVGVQVVPEFGGADLMPAYKGEAIRGWNSIDLASVPAEVISLGRGALQ